MKTTVLLLLASVCALVLATPSTKTDYTVANAAFIQKQKKVFRLFNYVNQPSYYKDFVQIADSFKFEKSWDQWTKPEFAKQFWHYYQHDILPKGEIFSIFYPEHLKQAVALFKTLYYAKDFEIFFKIAVWARQNVNEGMYVYALSVAIVHSKWTDDLVLPQIYEIFPQYFYNDEVIYKAQQYKQHYWGTYKHENEIKYKDFEGYTIQANYSNVHPKQSMTYYTEDVGINANYYYVHIYDPFWMDSEMLHSSPSQRGEYFFWIHQQRLARYYLERLSNGMGEIPHYSYELPIETGYYPSMTYSNGMQFPTRPNHADLYYHGAHSKQSYGNYTYSYNYVKDYEMRLRDALDMGFFYTPEGKIIKLFEKDSVGILANLVENNIDSLNRRYYGDLLMFSRHLLGYSYYPLDQYKLAPSALEHYETSMRDPMFWQMLKRVLYYYYQHQNYMGPYQKKDLYFDGVTIEDITVDRLVTYFDYFYTDISNAVTVNEKEFNEDSFEIRARQFRLNHKDFNYKVNVISKNSVEALVKIFIGPKYDEFRREIKIEENRKNFFEIDRFKQTLNAGKNVIERSSQDSMYFSEESFEEQINKMSGGNEQIKIYDYLKYFGFPQRLMLPKGDFGGKTYQFYIMIAPYHTEAKSNYYTKYLFDEEYSMGYPFDRPIEFEHEFLVPNSYFKDVKIYHKNVE